MAPTQTSTEPTEACRIDVWLTPTERVGGDLLAAYERLLSEEERARWQRLAVPDAKLQFLVARALLRTMLARRFGVPAAAWRFTANEYGRPAIAQPARHREIEFNLSHTSGLVACAVGRHCAVGIDVEDLRREIDVERLAETVCAPAEIARLAACPPERRRRDFLTLWTLKEAYIKARGIGLSLPLDGFWFDLDSAPPRGHFTARCPDDPGRWCFRRWTPTPHHLLAVAASAATPIDVRVRWVIPPPE